MRRRKHVETSKKVLGCTNAICFVFEALIMYGWLFKGLEDAHYMMGAVLTFHGGVIGFYTWKARTENMLKNGNLSGLKKIFQKLMEVDDDV